jgi:hypothetical protein
MLILKGHQLRLTPRNRYLSMGSRVRGNDVLLPLA